MSSIHSVRSASTQGVQINTPGKQRAVFMDRDGVLNEIDKHVNTPEQLDAALIPSSLAALARLSQQTDYKLILVTNQGGIDAGFMTEEQNNAIQERLAQRVEEAGGRLDGIYFCPNGKKFQLPEGEINARKPEAGMFYQAARDFGESVDLADSYMIGDMSTDIGAGDKAGVTTILVKTGFAGKDGKCPVQPDFVQDDLSSAVDFILARG